MCAARKIMGDHGKVLARSFSRQEQKKLAFGAFFCCFILAVNLSTVLKPYLDPPHIYFHVESIKPIIYNISNSRSEVHEINGDVRIQEFHGESMKPIICNFSNSISDVYEINGDVRIHGTSSTIFIASSHVMNLSSWTTQPYPRKGDAEAMKRVTDFKFKTETADRMPHCDRNLSIPAILFSSGGHAGNHFHAFADVLIPVFWTSHQFNRTIMFLVTNQNNDWTSKYTFILEKLSRYDVYDIDRENEVLCFSRMIIGLKARKNLEIDPSESTNFSVRNFTKLIQLERESVHDRHQTGKIIQPRVLIISRERSRRLMNEREIGDMARRLGFDVVVKKMYWNVTLTAQLVNSFDVMVGVHGAGLTNMVFLPEDAVLIQIVPFGLDHFAKSCFESAAEGMKLRYLKYKVSLNESSLLGKYPHDSAVYRDPGAVGRRGFDAFKTVYMDNQDVTLDLDRFRKTLLKALELVGT